MEHKKDMKMETAANSNNDVIKMIDISKDKDTKKSPRNSFPHDSV